MSIMITFSSCKIMRTVSECFTKESASSQHPKCISWVCYIFNSFEFDHHKILHMSQPMLLGHVQNFGGDTMIAFWNTEKHVFVKSEERFALLLWDSPRCSSAAPLALFCLVSWYGPSCWPSPHSPQGRCMGTYHHATITPNNNYFKELTPKRRN